jgi:hypothetical protein
MGDEDCKLQHPVDKLDAIVRTDPALTNGPVKVIRVQRLDLIL